MVLCSNVNELLWGKRQTANYKNIFCISTLHQVTFYKKLYSLFAL